MYSNFSQVVDITKEDLSFGFGLNSSDSIRQKGASDFGSEVLECTCTASQLNRLSEKALQGASGDCIVYFFEPNVEHDPGCWPLLIALSGTKRQRVLARVLVELLLAETSAGDQQGPSFVPEGAVEAAFRKDSAMEDHTLAFEVPAVVVESLLKGGSRPDVLNRGDAMFFFEQPRPVATEDIAVGSVKTGVENEGVAAAVEDNEEAAEHEDNRTVPGDENPDVKRDEAKQENEMDNSADASAQPNSVPASGPQDQVEQQEQNCQSTSDKADVELPHAEVVNAVPPVKFMSQAELMQAVNAAMMGAPPAAPPVVRTASPLNPVAAEFVPGSHQVTAKVWIVSSTEQGRSHGSFMLQAYIEENAGAGFSKLFHRKFLETTDAQLAEWEKDDFDSGAPKIRTDFFNEEADKIKFWLKGRVRIGTVSGWYTHGGTQSRSWHSSLHVRKILIGFDVMAT